MKLIPLFILSILANGIAAGDDFSSGGNDVTPAPDQGPNPFLIEIIEPEIPPTAYLVYDFVELGYLHTDFGNDLIDDGRGAAINFSKGLIGPFYLTGSTRWTSTNINRADADYYGVSLGLGYIIEISDSFHLNIESGGIYSKIDTDRASDHAFGAFISPGFRLCLNQSLEIHSSATYEISDGGNSTWQFDVGAVYDISDHAALTSSTIYNPDEDDLSILAGIRFYY